MTGQYILDAEGNPVACPDILTWGKWLAVKKNKVVLQTTSKEGILISTVFLGLDHSWDGGPPVLWETMIFGGKHDQYQERYISRSDAIAGHERAVRLVQCS